MSESEGIESLEWLPDPATQSPCLRRCDALSQGPGACRGQCPGVLSLCVPREEPGGSGRPFLLPKQTLARV